MMSVASVMIAMMMMMTLKVMTMTLTMMTCLLERSLLMSSKLFSCDLKNKLDILEKAYLSAKDTFNSRMSEEIKTFLQP